MFTQFSVEVANQWKIIIEIIAFLRVVCIKKSNLALTDIKQRSYELILSNVAANVLCNLTCEVIYILYLFGAISLRFNVISI